MSAATPPPLLFPNIYERNRIITPLIEIGRIGERGLHFQALIAMIHFQEIAQHSRLIKA